MDVQTEIGSDVYRAAELLGKGELVAIPTETVYGLAGNALSSSSVIKIFEAKNRPAFDPLIVHVANPAAAKVLATIPAHVEKWMEMMTPGPVTFILPKKAVVPDLVTSGHPTVGIRIPNHKLTLELLAQIDFPLAAPSANPFGYVSPTNANHVADQLGGKLPYILNGGECPVGIESTIIDVSGKKPTVLRLGGFELEELEQKMGVEFNDIRLSSSQPNAPGMLHSHYAPKVKLYAYDEAPMDSIGKNVGAIRFKEYDANLIKENQIILSESGNTREAAQNLFKSLRQLEALDIDYALVEFVPQKGLGKAINDRLTRATARR